MTVCHALAVEPPDGRALSATGPLPVTLTLDKPGYVTAVIERADGRRVGNLVSEVKAQAGALTLNWDLYDVGVRKGEKEPYVRTLVEPGTYRVRGLVHDGLDLRYEFSVYSPGQPPWKTADTSGAWMGVGLCTIDEKDRHEVLLKFSPLKPFPVIDTYNFLDLAVQNGLAVILNGPPPSANLRLDAARLSTFFVHDAASRDI